MSRFEKPVSEQFAKQNKELGEKVAESKKGKEEYEDAPLKSKLSPFYWLERKWARESHESNEQAYNQMLEKVKEHGAEIQEEANNYVAARGEYESTQRQLAETAGVAPSMVSMNEFIEEMDGQSRYLPRPEIPSGASQEEQERINAEWYKQNGKILAARDLFTPALPIGDKTGRYKYSVVEMKGHSYRTGWGGERVPRLETGKDLSDALSEAKEKGAKYVFKLSSGVEHRYGGEVDRQAKYVVLDDETAKFLKENERFLSGATPLYDEGPMSMGTPPWMTINFEGEIVPVVELENQGEKISITLKFEVENAMSGKKDQRSVTLSGSLDELRKEAGKRIFREEWAPGSEANVVHNAIVEIDGQEVPWEEFIGHASEAE
ncbi:MAG: hypothetical protein ABIJ19_02290 [Patescibacteria group bacterium]